MEITFVSINYKTDKQQVHIFLDNIVQQFTDRGVVCNVISPQSWFSKLFKRKNIRKYKMTFETERGNKYNVYSPMFTVWPTKKIGKKHLADCSRTSFFKAVKRTYKKQKMNADYIYAHFLQAGIPAVRFAQELNIPSFIACGEADTVESVESISREVIAYTLDKVTGIIAVSTKNKNEIAELANGNEKINKKVSIIPNAVKCERFYKKDKKECREKLGFLQDSFIVAFTGSFIERKGTNRLSRAIDSLEGVNSVFIGRGELEPDCGGILFKGRVPNTEVSVYLNAADIFVLPTLAEGCCNAIVEAMACGLPIVSSDLPFNHDICNENNSILVDPMNIEEIAAAINTLKNDGSLRERLSEGSLCMAKDLTIETRTEKINSFINLMSKKGD